MCVCVCLCVRDVFFAAAQTFVFSDLSGKKKDTKRDRPTSSRITTPLTLPPLTLCTALPFVADGAHAVAVGAGAVAAAKGVDALRDGDIALGSLPAAVAHTGALVVLAIATAQHRARRWRRGDGGGKEWGEREIKPRARQKKNN